MARKFVKKSPPAFKTFGTTADITMHLKPPFNFPGNKSNRRKDIEGLFKYLVTFIPDDENVIIADVFGGSMFVSHIAAYSIGHLDNVVIRTQDFDDYASQFSDDMYKCCEEMRQTILGMEPDIKREQPLQKATAEAVVRIADRYPDNIRRLALSKCNALACRGGLGTIRMRFSRNSPMLQEPIERYLGGVQIMPPTDWKDFVRTLNIEFGSTPIIWILDPPYHKHSSRLGYVAKKDIPAQNIVEWIREERGNLAGDAYITFGFKDFPECPDAHLWNMYLSYPRQMQVVFRLEHSHLWLNENSIYTPPPVPSIACNAKSLQKRHGDKVLVPRNTPDFR